MAKAKSSVLGSLEVSQLISLEEFAILNKVGNAIKESLRVEVGAKDSVSIEKTKSEWLCTLNNMLTRHPK